jgi:hypothetical protein
MAYIQEGNYELQYFPFPNKCLRAHCDIDPTAIVPTDFPSYWYYKKTDCQIVWSNLTATTAVDVTVKFQKRVSFTTHEGNAFQSPWVDITGAAYHITSDQGTAYVFLDDFEGSEFRVTASVVDCLGGSVEVFLIAKSW